MKLTKSILIINDILVMLVPIRRKKHIRSVKSLWKIVKKFTICFLAICVIPFALFIVFTREMKSNINIESIKSNLNVQKYYRPNDKNPTAIDERLQMRRLHLKKMCKNLGLHQIGNDSLHQPNPWEFLISSKYHLVWCNVFKAASTSWMYNFNILAGYRRTFLEESKIVPLTLARRHYPRPTLDQLNEAFNTSLSFIIVRHPFERLLSAYRDKLQNAFPHTHHRKMGNEIIMKYRSKKVLREKNLQQKQPRNNPVWPTFAEFILYLFDCIKSGQMLDMHWTPIVEFCTPCMFDFDVIAHTETLKDDQNFIIKKAKLDGLIKSEWKNAGHGKNLIKSSTRYVESYYGQLTRSQIIKLYHIYRYDFELFNYTLDSYLEMGIPDSDPSALLAAITSRDEQIFNKDQLQIY